MKSKTIMGMSLALLLGIGLAACDQTGSSTIPSESSESSQEQGTTVNMGETLQLTTTLTGTAVWSSNNDQVATVSETGLVTGIIPGDVVITATVGDQSETFELTVVDPEGSTNGRITIDYDNLPVEITAGDTVDLDDYVEVTGVTNWYLTTPNGDLTPSPRTRPVSSPSPSAPEPPAGPITAPSSPKPSKPSMPSSSRSKTTTSPIASSMEC